MDLNELLFHHQIALMRAGQPGHRRARGYCDQVRHFEGRIARLRERLGVSAYPKLLAGQLPCAS